MSEAKHTPGPWRSELDADGDHGIFYATDLIAVTDGWGDSSTSDRSLDEDKANAHLIAAAPELLDALHQARLQIDYLHEKFRITGTGNTVLTRIDEAIAKAEGRQVRA